MGSLIGRLNVFSGAINSAACILYVPFPSEFAGLPRSFLSESSSLAIPKGRSNEAKAIALVMYKQQVGLELQSLYKGRREARHVEVAVVGIRREIIQRLEDRLLGHGLVSIRVRRRLCRRV